MDIYGYSAHVLVNGRKVKEYRHEGDNYIEAKKGTEYSIEVRNHTPNRSLAIISVDGLNIIDGEPAGEDSSGYILQPFSSQVFKGWRKDENTVGAFKFTDRHKSYAKDSQGCSINCGVVGVLIYEEKRHTHIFNHDYTHNYCDHLRGKLGDIKYGANTQAGGLSRQSLTTDWCEPEYSVYCSNNTTDYTITASSFDLGTTWGSKQHEYAREEKFERGNRVGEMILYYDSRDNLIKRGISLVNYRSVASGKPQAFPKQYASPPSWWG